jgi:hypothetical protein
MAYAKYAHQVRQGAARTVKPRRTGPETAPLTSRPQTVKTYRPSGRLVYSFFASAVQAEGSASRPTSWVR